eukprot:CAMPEP_0194321646 /NCGR_PEP_ID=MMETSP0171-20130528/17856_1 /TAXON_ID=218684 /ORGANISM="Corethron pennatum, Strain L29A3" /LENGTH=67 /DNA_ID=CAMNT_0039079631 /DNA_START=346 /DNA_END=549 /DNA_ORIENTATION=+
MAEIRGEVDRQRRVTQRVSSETDSIMAAIVERNVNYRSPAPAETPKKKKIRLGKMLKKIHRRTEKGS